MSACLIGPLALKKKQPSTALSSLMNISLNRQQLIHEQAAHSGDKTYDEQREQLKGKHTQLTKELLEVKTKLHHVEKETKALQKEILEAGENTCTL